MFRYFVSVQLIIVGCVLTVLTVLTALTVLSNAKMHLYPPSLRRPLRSRQSVETRTDLRGWTDWRTIRHYQTPHWIGWDWRGAINCDHISWSLITINTQHLLKTPPYAATLGFISLISTFLTFKQVFSVIWLPSFSSLSESSKDWRVQSKYCLRGISLSDLRNTTVRQRSLNWFPVYANHWKNLKIVAAEGRVSHRW